MQSVGRSALPAESISIDYTGLTVHVNPDTLIVNQARKGIGDMFRQLASRNQGEWIRIMLLIVLTALLMNGATFVHHHNDDPSAMVCEYSNDSHDDVVYDNAATIVQIPILADCGTHRHPLWNHLVLKLIYASIFHPPKAG